MSDSFKIFETDQFLKDLRHLNIKENDSKYQKIKRYVYPQLQLNPYHGKNIKKLQNWKPETWRYRIGNFRLFYIVDDLVKIISIIAFEPRDKAY